MKMKIYGCRGSAAFSRESQYGGNTSCITLMHTNGKSLLVLDAGSGLMQLNAELRSKFAWYPNNMPFRMNILLSHLHHDHISGLIGFMPIFAEKNTVKIFTCSRNEKPLNEQICGAFVPPYWPVPLVSLLRAKCVEVTGKFDIDGFTVTPFAANHPDKTLSYHITDGYKSVVYLLDNEMPAVDEEVLLAFCKDADMVVFDAAYLPSDFSQKKGFGHATVREGIKLANDSNAKRMIFAHYSQEYSDAELELLKKEVPIDRRFLLAHDGLEIEI